MRKVLVVILAAALAGIQAACSAQQAAHGTQTLSPDRTSVGVRGEIASRNENPDGSITILVEGQKEPDTEYDRASVTVTDRILITKDGADCTLDDLTVGVRVEADIPGPVMESYPVQGGASAVRILPQE